MASNTVRRNPGRRCPNRWPGGVQNAGQAVAPSPDASDPSRALTGTRFSDLKPPLSGEISKHFPTPASMFCTSVQAATIPKLLSHKDVTGSGKSLAFLISLVEILRRSPPPKLARQIPLLVPNQISPAAKTSSHSTFLTSQLIEKLPVKTPSGEVKLKVLKEIAKEYQVDWDLAETEGELLKPPEMRIDGPSDFRSASNLPVEAINKPYENLTMDSLVHEVLYRI